MGYLDVFTALEYDHWWHGTGAVTVGIGHTPWSPPSLWSQPVTSQNINSWNNIGMLERQLYFGLHLDQQI